MKPHIFVSLTWRNKYQNIITNLFKILIKKQIMITAIADQKITVQLKENVSPKE